MRICDTQAYEPNGTYLFGIDLSPATPPGATIQTIQGVGTARSVVAPFMTRRPTTAAPCCSLTGVQLTAVTSRCCNFGATSV